jgi:thiamine biosynthesis lipoprotein
VLTRVTILAWIGLCLLRMSPAGAELRRYEYSADGMGGTFSIALYTDVRARGDSAAAAAFGELRRLEGLLSHYRPESAWSEVNRHAAERAVHVPQEVFDVISASIEFSRRSEGAFDITVGPLMRAWDFRDGEGRMAADRVIRSARSRVGFAHVLLDETSRTVRFARPGIELDPGGIGKGYAVDRMIAVLKQHGIDRALVSAARSSIYALGTPPDAGGWPVELGDPVAGSHLGEVLLENESLSTSGVSGRSFIAAGRRYGHIVDPRTGYPAGGFLAAVVAPRAIESEAWTKAALLNGPSWTAAHTPAGWRVFLCHSDEVSSCRWIR